MKGCTDDAPPIELTVPGEKDRASRDGSEDTPEAADPSAAKAKRNGRTKRKRNKKGVKYCRCEDQSTSTVDSVGDVGSIALDIDDL